MQLTEKRSTNVPGADDEKTQPFTPFEESPVNNVQSARLLRGIDNARDVALGRALRDRTNIYVVPAKRPEHFARNTGVSFHPVADNRDNGLIGFFI